MIKKFEEYISEGLWKSGVDRAKSDTLRKEQGIKVKLPNGKTVILDDTYQGIPYKIDGEYYKLVLEDSGREVYVFGFKDGDVFNYYFYDDYLNNHQEDLTFLVESDYDMVEDDFIIFEACYLSQDLYKDIYNGVRIKTVNETTYICEDRYHRFVVFKGESDMERFFLDYLPKKIMDSFDIRNYSNLNKNSFTVAVANFIDDYGYDYFNGDSLRYVLKKSGVDEIPTDLDEIVEVAYDKLGPEEIVKHIDFNKAAECVLSAVDSYGELAEVVSQEQINIDDTEIHLFEIK